MRIGLKLTAAFMAIASLVGVAGYLAHGTSKQVEQQLDRLSRSAVIRVADASQMAVALHADQLAAHRHLHALAIAEDSAKQAAQETWQKQLADRQLLIEESLDRQSQVADSMIRWAQGRGWDALAQRERSQTLGTLDELRAAIQDHLRIQRAFVAAARSDPAQAERLFAGPLSEQFEQQLLPCLATYRRQADDELTEVVRATERAIATAELRRSWLMIAAAMGAVLLGLVTSRMIGRSMAQLQHAAEQIGQGRFDVRVPITAHDEIGLLANSVNQMAASLQETTVSRSYLDNIIQSMREMLIVVDPELQITHVNQAACAELHYGHDELQGLSVTPLFELGDLSHSEPLPAVLAPGIECAMRTQAGQLIPVHCSAAAIHSEDGTPKGYVCVASNISRQQEAEERLVASLREKELLLKEVHHRVKNNLQVISSLLNLQAREIQDPQTVQLFRESQGRIQSMALIHEQLYRSSDLASIDFAAYVRDLVGHLERGLGDQAVPVRFRLDIEPIPLPLDLAIPCGMIVNELVSNALKHAFPRRQGGEVQIAFQRGPGGYTLRVADDGVGMRPQEVAADQPSLGLQVVHSLTKQLHGELAVRQDAGTVFEILFHPEQDGQQ